jgi:hypothetical protein
MGVQVEPNVANVFSGPAAIYIAPYPATFPTLTAKPTAADWATAGFTRVGYTEAGLDVTVTPSTKDIIADESIVPLKTLITAIKVEAKCTLMEATLENLERTVALSVISNPGTGIKTLSVGSGNSLKEFALGMQGPGPGGADDRVFCLWRSNVTSATTQSYKRADVSKIAATFNGLSDSTKATTVDVCECIDYNAGS